MIEKIFSLVTCFGLIAILAGCSPVKNGSASELNPTKTKSNPNTIELISTDSVTNPVHIATLENGISMRVLWTVSGYVIGKGSTWGEQEAKALLFKPLDINDTEITFDGQVCKGVIFRKETVNAAEYLSTIWQVTTQSLGIEDQKMQIFKTNCTLPGFTEYIRLSDRRLIVTINGVFFFFEPAVNY